jgi:hypothetical protein
MCTLAADQRVADREGPLTKVRAIGALLAEPLGHGLAREFILGSHVVVAARDE